MTSQLTADNSGTPLTHTPTIVLGYETERRSLNIVHNILGGGIAVSLRGSDLRSGTLAFGFEAETDAVACANDLALPLVWAFADDDVTSVDMSFIVNGTVRLELDDETRDAWSVYVDYQEVTP